MDVALVYLSVKLSPAMAVGTLQYGHYHMWTGWRLPDLLTLSGSQFLRGDVSVWRLTDSHSEQPAGWCNLIRLIVSNLFDHHCL